MSKRRASTVGDVVLVGEDNRPYTIPPGNECEVEQSPASNSYIVRWEDHGTPHAGVLSAVQYFDLVRTKRLQVQSKRR
jgi:hypothetical protein